MSEQKTNVMVYTPDRHDEIVSAILSVIGELRDEEVEIHVEKEEKKPKVEHVFDMEELLGE